MAIEQIVKERKRYKRLCQQVKVVEKLSDELPQRLNSTQSLDLIEAIHGLVNIIEGRGE